MINNNNFINTIEKYSTVWRDYRVNKFNLDRNLTYRQSRVKSSMLFFVIYEKFHKI